MDEPVLDVDAGVDLLAEPRHGIAKLGIARTFQNLALFPSMTLLENVMVGGACKLGSLEQSIRMPERADAEPLVLSEESKELAWVALADVASLESDESVMRMVAKTAVTTARS